MLLQTTKIDSSEVVVLKPLQGPDIIGRLTDTFNTGDDWIALRKPVEAHMVQGDKGSLGLAFSPFSLAAKDDQVFRIPRSNLLVDPFPARDEVKKTYTEQTSSLKLL